MPLIACLPFFRRRLSSGNQWSSYAPDLRCADQRRPRKPPKPPPPKRPPKPPPPPNRSPPPKPPPLNPPPKPPEWLAKLLKWLSPALRACDSRSAHDEAPEAP